MHRGFLLSMRGDAEVWTILRFLFCLWRLLRGKRVAGGVDAWERRQKSFFARLWM